jgi:pyruvate kinase
MRRAKIVATLGPASSTYDQIRAIVEAGVDVARMNLSHGSHSVHEEIYNTVRKVAKDLQKPIGIFVDLQGPKIRLGNSNQDLIYLRRAMFSKSLSKTLLALKKSVEQLSKVSVVTSKLAISF